MRFQWGFLRRPHRRANDEMEGTRTCFVSRQDRKELSASEVGDYAFCARTWLPPPGAGPAAGDR